MSFHVGQKVVCIDGDFKNPHYEPPGAMPDKGGIYTIRSMEMATCGYSGAIQLGLRFYEFVYPPVACGHEPCFAARCFRPLIERKTDIAIFQRMLIPSKQGIEA